MGKLFTSLKRLSGRTSALIAIVLAAVIIPATLFAWGPDRPTYTINNPADHVTFNSITDNPQIGDERNFVGIRESGTNGTWSDNMTAQPGKEYVVRMYVHNNAASSLNKVAENVKAKINLPTTTGKSIQVNGFINSSNAAPQEVYDHAIFNSTSNFNLSYKTGSLKYYNNASGANGFTIPESVFTSAGAPLGYDKMDGRIPGCFQYAGYLTFIVKPQFGTPTPDFNLNKEVRKAGTPTFVESIDAKAGDKLNYRVTVNNSGATQLNNISLKDKLPKGITNVPGTVRIMNANHPGGAYIQDGDKLFTTGVNIGSYTAGSNAIVIFDAMVGSNNDLPVCGPNTLRNIAAAQPEGQNPKEDGADVKVPKECQVECKYSCDSLTVDKIDRTTFKFTTATTQQSATFKKVTYVIRNEQGAEVDRKESTDKTLTYTRTTVGKFTVEALVTFTVNGQDKTVTSASCKKPFEVEKEPETPAYKCDGLTVEKINRTSFKFATQYTATGGATLKSIVYVIRDAQGTEIARQTSANYTQDKVGSYTVEAIVTVTVNGQDKVAPGDCKKPFVVEKEPETPVYTCDSLTFSKISHTEYSFTGKATATGGATIVNYAFDFGDNTPVQTVTNPADVKHTYAKDGTYTAKLSVTVKVEDANKTITSEKCKVTVTVTPEECKPGIPVGDERCVDECKPGVPVGHKDCEEKPECKPGIPMGDDRCEEKPEFCIVKGKEHLPKNSPDCKETPVVTELPKTGASDSIVALIGAGSLIASIGYYVASRRSL